MTAEIAIINRHAIALAADSAVTIGRDKVFKTANKLFSLGPHHDIAVMIYGSGDFLSLPWEVVIKAYRARAAALKFKRVEECAEDFKNFLLTSMFDRKGDQEYSVLFPLYDYVSAIRDACKEDDAPIDIGAVLTEIGRIRAVLQAKDILFADLDVAVFEERFTDRIANFAQGFLGIDDDDIASVARALCGLAYDAFRAQHESQYSSGLVVAGFGEDEYFPSLIHHAVDGRLGPHLRMWKESNCTDLNDEDQANAFPIIPFAQQDMAFQFMTGLAPGYLSYLDEGVAALMEGTVADILAEHLAGEDLAAAREDAHKTAKTAADAFMERFKEKLRKEQFRPIGRAVSSLPKEEMAAMAEALVDITSLKRKVDSRLESVGGAVDVAVISKGDGFIWIKRKHYFSLELNQDFLRRRKRANGDVT